VPFLLLAPLLLALSGCPSDKPQPGGPDDNAARVARERAASLFAQELFSAALAELEPLLATKNPDPNDQLRAALTLLEFAEGSAAKRAMELLQSAAQAMPDDPRVHYALGSRLNFSGQDELAEGHLRKAMALAPQDLPTQVRLSDVLVVLAYDAEPAEADARLAEALQLLTALRSRGLEFNGSWHLTVLHKAQLLLRQLDRTEEADLAQRELSELESRRIKKPTNPELMRGNLGRLDIPRPAGSQSPAVPDPIIEPAQLLSGEGQVRQAFSQALQERWHALVGDDLVDPASLPKEVDSARLLLDAAPSPSDLVFVDQRGLWMQSEQGQRELLVPGTVERFVGLDLGEDKSTRDTVEGQLPDGRAFVR
jgi:tetratricopeptide (TPR) repeat protein